MIASERTLQSGSQKATPDQSDPAANNNAFAPPTLSLPKGGGAIRGMGEKFAANPVTGTGSMTVPIATSPGRSGFGPQLALSYDSGAGNGPFGLGWNLSLPAITRKTDKGLPQYRDAEESDVFILSGAEDLVPELEPGGKRVEDKETFPGFVVHRYRPRIEGLFARIERWTHIETGAIHWRSISKDNITTLYGRSNDSRIFDPTDPNYDPHDLQKPPTRIFNWLICQSYDDKGNAIVYDYRTENNDELDLSQANERNRVRTANRYLKRIRYGNRTPNRDNRGKAIDPTTLPVNDWMFEAVFDYGDHDLATPTPRDDEIKDGDTLKFPWKPRPDPFSSYRAGFEVRTYRLCQRVLMFHHFPGEESVGENCLVRSTDFTYGSEVEPQAAAHPTYSKLRSVTQSGYKRNGDSYISKSLPPLEFTYSEAQLQNEVHSVDPASLENLPVGLDGTLYQWTDLHGEGIPGILTEQAGAWFYKRNLSPINSQGANGESHRQAKFAPVELVALKPNLALGNGAQLMDLAGDGQPDLVVMDGPLPGFYEHDLAEGWNAFRPFTARLNHDTRDPNLKFVDLDGDGHADVLITEDQAFIWHPSLGEAGFGPARRVYQTLDEEKGPRLVFANSEQAIYLADLSGDGLTDLVRIRNGAVCYWPNLGYGCFGAKVSMDNAPWFDTPDQFNQQRIRLADIDGSGTTDIIYLHGKGVRIYFNQSGNRWSAAQPIPFPAIDNLAAVQAVDLLGDGTACLVWSSPLPGAVRHPMHYLKLMGEEKPHLLVKTVNNLGAETVVQYAPSTRFYLADKVAGKPWITRLPFPVHVVERVESYDRVSGNRFVSRYAYHHGYFDGEEREFRGFGMVEQWDTEEIGTVAPDQQRSTATNLDAASYVPPVLTRTWFHTGIYLDRERVSRLFAGLCDQKDRGDYYREPAWLDNDKEAEKHLLADTLLPGDLSLAEEREACRALKGAMLRQEVYALDGVGKTEDYPFGHPYTVAEQNFAIRRLQPQGENRHAVFFTHPNEVLTYHYERNEMDPRIQHALTLEVDEFGNVLKSLAIGYGRRPGISPLQDTDSAKQEQTLITYSETDYTKHDTTDAEAWRDAHRTPLPCEARTYEITGFALPAGAVRFPFEEFAKDDDFSALTELQPVNYEAPVAPDVRGKRLIECIRTRYRRDDLTALLPVGTLQPQALPGESYKLAFTPTLVSHLFTRRPDGQPDEALLPNPALVLEGAGSGQGGYVALEGNWWIPSGQIYYSPDENDDAAGERDFARRHFYLPHRFRDPFGQPTYLFYDSNDAQPEKGHNLLVVKTEDALGNSVVAANDYRVLQPRQITDPNGNRSQVKFDALGMVVGTAVMGKAEGPVEGDSFDNFIVDLTAQGIKDYFDAADPHLLAVTHLGTATTRILYDLDRVPACAATIARETHVSDLHNQPHSRVQLNFSYSDGFGREIQKKIQAEPGTVAQRHPAGTLVVGDDGQPVMTDHHVSPRWVGSGWTLFNNKGKPVRQFEPFFSDTHKLDHDVRIGVSPWLFYDPVERVVATLHPNHTWEKVVFDSWQQTTYDVNDTVTSIPSADDNVKGFFLNPDDTPRLPVDEYQPTWHELRTDPTYAAEFAARYASADDRTHETVAAAQAVDHANTPTIAHFDALGRPFLTIADNGVAGPYETRVELDIEGNQRSVTDARGRIVMQYAYDMLGNRVHQASMEAGERWLLSDAGGKPIRTWDSRRFIRRMSYDQLRRPLGLFVSADGAPEFQAQKTAYGESKPGDPKATNHLGKIWKVYDGAGIVTSEEYDFKGNLRSSTRHLLPDYKSQVNWLDAPVVNDEGYPSQTTYDALNRPRTVTTPDRSVYRPTFNEANLLDKVEVNLRAARDANEQPLWTPFVDNINYDAKGQRVLIAYGSGAAPAQQGITTTYDYDPLTLRLRRLRTTRPPGLNGTISQLFVDPAIVQDLHYTYDPVGNITHIQDAALKTILHAGQTVAPLGSYTYDAIYRLTDASGREHIGQTAHDFNPQNRRDFDFTGLTHFAAHQNELQAMRSYSEHYEYDAVGNFDHVRHSANGGSWTRTYEYAAASLIEPAQQSNRLTKTTVGNMGNHVETYTYTDRQGNDVHGCMTAINTMQMAWDFADQLAQVDLQGGGTAYYVYDVAGQRVRKVIENQLGTPVEERVYLGGFEVYRKLSGQDAGLVRETLHIMDDKQRVALVETRNEVDDGSARQLTRYQLGNHLGSASLELDQKGGLISYEEYHPYGTTAFQAGRSAAEVSLKRYRYTGKERDEETGFSYHEARYYATWLGRWISCDPSGVIDGPNTYGYVRGNPVRMTDPSGHQTKVDVPTVSIIPFKGSKPSPPEESSSRGIYSKDKKKAAELLKNYPDTKTKFDIDHMNPYVTSPPGSTQKFRLRPSSHAENPHLSPHASTNRGESGIARRQATENRQKPDWQDPKSPNYARPIKSKGEAPKVEAPKVEAPKVETPKVETPKVETPKVEAPKVEAPKVETPKVETPKVETPKVETPKVEAPKVEAPKVETPKLGKATSALKAAGAANDALLLGQMATSETPEETHAVLVDAAFAPVELALKYSPSALFYKHVLGVDPMKIKMPTLPWSERAKFEAAARRHGQTLAR